MRVGRNLTWQASRGNNCGVTATLDRTAYLSHFRADADALAAAGERGRDSPIPSCPEWKMGDLLTHTGMVHRWAAAIVRGGLLERPPFKAYVAPDGVDLVAWYRASAADVADALAEADPDRPMYNFTGATQTAAFWVRRQAQEVSIHRWDAEAAVGSARPINALLAADGVDEQLAMLGFAVRSTKPDLSLGGSLHLHATDADGEWMIGIENGHMTIKHGHGKGDAAVRGPAGTLNLAMWGRVSLADEPGFERFGDASVISAFSGAL